MWVGVGLPEGADEGVEGSGDCEEGEVESSAAVAGGFEGFAREFVVGVWGHAVDVFVGFFGLEEAKTEIRCDEGGNTS